MAHDQTQQSWIRLICGGLCCLLPMLVAGCSGKQTNATAPPAKIVPERGTLDIDVIVHANPQQAVLNSINAAIANAEHRERVGAGDATRQRALQRAEAPRPHVDVPNVNRREQGLLAFQAQRLNALQTQILANLDARLQRADDQRLASIQARLSAAVEQSYLTRVDSIDDQADADELDAGAEDRATVVNLLAKIGALTANVQPPPTAPDGYWNARLLARRSELELLDARRRAQVARILTDRDHRRRDLKAQLQGEADASYQEEAASSKLRREALLETTSQRLRVQTSEILVSARTLDREAGAPGTPVVDPLGANPITSSAELPHMDSAPAMERGDLTALLREQARLKAQIRRQTLQTVKEVARSRHAVIVGYRHQAGVRDITSDVMMWVKTDRWG